MTKKKRISKKLTPEQRAAAKVLKAKKTEEKRQKKLEREYYNSIENIFKFSGFLSMPVENEQFDIANRPNCELDHCFVSENVIVICEQTVGIKDSSHLLKKQETASVICRDSATKNQFLQYLTSKYQNVFNGSKYGCARWKIFYLYFSKQRIDFNDIDKARYDKLRFIDIGTYNYLVNLSKCLKHSFVYEILRFLDVNYNDYGSVSPGGGTPLPTRDVSIIYPSDVTGLNQGVGIVSFMMSPEEIIKTSYVLRKDNWEEKIGLYQRLITEKRIKSVRKFILETKRTFFNNIIVGLPEAIKIYGQDGTEISINELDRYQNCTMKLSEGFNTLCIIDGQHRVYSYYENDISDSEEIAVSNLRNKLNLLVTGIIFPKEWSEIKKREFQSDIFVQINKNSKNVASDILTHIESTKNPFSPMAIARKTLEKMNISEPFKNLFELSLVEKARIKVSSITQFALSALVNPKDEAYGFYKYWTPSNQVKKPKQLEDENLLNEYVSFCANTLNQYFCAIKTKFQVFWDDPKSSILRIVSINGFIIALHHSLRLTSGAKDFAFYKEILSLSDLDFSKGKFLYAGSRYSQFAIEQIDPLFYEKCEEQYFKLINLSSESLIKFIEDDSITAILDSNSKFIYKEEPLSLYELTKKVKNVSGNLNDIAGKYWTFGNQTLQTIFENSFLNSGS
ncbi:MAG: DGQHR domain-containing protein [Bacillota bacterium]